MSDGGRSRREITDDLGEMARDRALELDGLLAYLTRARSFDFAVYKRTTISRRVARRMRLVGVASIAQYQSYLAAHPSELPRLRDAVLVNVTGFFRDPTAWSALARHVRRMLEADVA